jgi:CheY-like chemotaxis protein
LDLSKIEAGKLALNPVNYDFHALLDNIFSMFSYVAQKKGLKFHHEVEGKMPDYLYGDDIRLKQVLTNICGNAIKYTEKGYVSFKVSVADNNIVFEIKDSGIGIRKEDIPKLFNVFQRIETGKSRGIVGTGLGLSISKSFVDMMGGKILVDSEYEQGSVFIIMIPIVLGSREGIILKRKSVDYTLQAPDARILLVDDNEFNIRVAEGLFGLFKVNVQTAFSGKKAIELVQNNDYDIVFMDHMMPEMDGIEATANIRKMGGKYKHLPIIALTANAVQGVKEMFLSSGFNGFISKPIGIQEVYRILKEWLPPDKVQEQEMPEEQTETAEGKTYSDFLMELNKVSEINVEIGLDCVSGMEDMYRETLVFFNHKIEADCDAMSDRIHNRDVKGFSILAHDLKSALATIGALNLSEAALRMEMAAKSGDIAYCTQRFPGFRNKLLILHEELSAIFPKAEPTKNKPAGDTAYLRKNIEKALDAASDFDSDAGLTAINDLLTYDFGEQNNASLESAAAAFKEFNYDAAVEQLNKLK